MKIKVYANWGCQIVENTTDFEKRVKEQVEDLSRDDSFFSDWLDDNFSTAEIFNMSEQDKKSALEDFMDKCQTQAREDLEGDGWEEVEIEI